MAGKDSAKKKESKFGACKHVWPKCNQPVYDTTWRGSAFEVLGDTEGRAEVSLIQGKDRHVEGEFTLLFPFTTFGVR